MRSMVEGLVGRNRTQNVLHYRRHIVEHRSSRDPKNAQSLTSKPSIASEIPLRSFAAPMHFAINFDNEPMIGAEEVEHIAPRRMLTTELQPAGPLAEFGPEDHLRQRQLAAQAACSADGAAGPGQHFASPSTMLRMVPLPLRGRN